MGMYASFRPIDAETAEQIKQDPALIERLLDAEEEDDDHESLGVVDVDKAWHGLHFLLTTIAGDEDAPLAQAIFGGMDVGDSDGDIPARLLDPAEVSEIAAALATVTVEQLREAYDPEDMDEDEIYPSIWVRDGDEALDYLLHHFPTLVGFYRDAAARGQAALLRIG